MQFYNCLIYLNLIILVLAHLAILYVSIHLVSMSLHASKTTINLIPGSNSQAVAKQGPAEGVIPVFMAVIPF